MRHTVRPGLFAALLAVTLATAASGSAAFAADPKPTAAPARSLAITGGVERPLELSADRLRQRPAHQIVELQLPGKAGGAPSVVRGVRLRDLLDEAKIVTRDHNTVKKLAVIAGASDGYKVVFSWSELFNSPAGDSVLVLFERDGKPLPAAEGPLALVAGKDLRTGPRHVKWLQAVEVRQIVE